MAKGLKNICGALSLILLSFSCVKEGQTIYIETDEDDEKRDMVFFVSREDSLGDIGYVDALYRAVIKNALQYNIMVSVLELPSDSTKTIAALQYTLNYMQTENGDRKALVVIANDNLEPLLHSCEDILDSAPNVNFLLCESKDTTLPIYTLQILQYGVYYQAGMLVSESLQDVDSVLIVKANREEMNISDMGQGFRDAITDSGKDIYVEETFLAETSGGYNLANYTYEQSYEIDKSFSMVIPLCGGSAQGFYRYNRENPESFYTIGVDTDMQLYSPRVPFSIVKYFDDILDKWITDWWQENEIQQHQTHSLASGGTGLVIAEEYGEALDEEAEKYLPLAIEKEQEYENQ